MLNYVIATLGIALVTFGGVARRDEIADIQKKLILLSQESVVDYHAVDGQGVPLDGLCKVINLKFKVMNTQPPMVNFTGQLVYPFHRDE